MIGEVHIGEWKIEDAGEMEYLKEKGFKEIRMQGGHRYYPLNFSFCLKHIQHFTQAKLFTGLLAFGKPCPVSAIWYEYPPWGIDFKNNNILTLYHFTYFFLMSLSYFRKLHIFKRNLCKGIRCVALAGMAQLGLWTKGSPVWLLVRAHAWVAGLVPSWGHMRGNHTLTFLSLSFSLPFSKNK